MSRSQGAPRATFYLGIKGLPGHFTWQHLKDEAKKIAQHVNWTEMSLWSGSIPRGCGNIRLCKRTDAVNLYNHFVSRGVEGRALEVYLFDITSSEPRLLYTNMRSDPVHGHRSTEMRETMYRAASHHDWMTLSRRAVQDGFVYPPTSPTGTYSTASSSTQGLDDQFARMQFDQGYHDPRLTSPISAVAPRQSLATNGSMSSRPAIDQHWHITDNAWSNINPTGGVVRTTKRTIHVSNLPSEHEIDVIELLRQTPLVQEPDPQGPTRARYILAKYGTPATAQQVARQLNSRMVQGRRIKVKIAADSETESLYGSTITDQSRSEYYYGPVGNAGSASSTSRSSRSTRSSESKSRSLKSKDTASNSGQTLQTMRPPAIVNGSGRGR